MEQFSLEKAKDGHPVQTKNGRNVRILCFDKQTLNYPIVTLVVEGYEERIREFTKQGKISINDNDNMYDLVMKPQKKEGYLYYNEGKIREI